MKEGPKKIVITGVSRGLGRAMAEGFAGLGHTVWGCARSASELKELEATWGSPHQFAVVDVVEESMVGDWAARFVREHTAPDLLINCAALINRNGSLWRIPKNEFDTVIDVNIKGVANVIRHFVPAMVGRKKGIIVNFSSGWGRSVSPDVAPYCATKWAIEGMTKALAEELPRGMAAVPLNPGIIDTAMLRSCFGGSAQSYPSARNWAKQAVPYLLSLGPESNGQSLSVPGVPVE